MDVLCALAVIIGLNLIIDIDYVDKHWKNRCYKGLAIHLGFIFMTTLCLYVVFDSIVREIL